MIVQNCVKGIAGGSSGITKNQAFDLVANGTGIISNWWRNKGSILANEAASLLTSTNLDRHLHDYQNFGAHTPFISLSAGSVRRLATHNEVYSAIDTALEFATNWWRHSGALFYCWVPVNLNPAPEIQAFAEEVRALHTYKRWSPYQLEGEITAKIQVHANQIEKVEWWEKYGDEFRVTSTFWNKNFVTPISVSNLRELF